MASNIIIQFKVDKVTGITLGTAPHQNRVVIPLSTGLAVGGGVNYARAIRVDDKNQLKNAGNIANRLREKTTGADINPVNLRTLHLDCADLTEALTARALLELKSSQSSADFRFWINDLNYDDDKAFEASDPTTYLDIQGDILTLKPSDFGDLTNLKISDVNFDGLNPVAPITGRDYDTNEATWVLSPSSEGTKLIAKLAQLLSLVPQNASELENFNITTITQAEIDFLYHFKDETTLTDPKAIVYNLDFFKDTIDEAINLLEEMRTWKDLGFTNVAEVLRANANGYWIKTRNGGGDVSLGELHKPPGASGLVISPNALHANNLKVGTSQGDVNLAYLFDQTKKYVIKKDQTYMGFPTFDSSQKISKVSSPISVDQNEVIFGYIAEEAPALNMENIESLRSFTVKNDTDNNPAPEFSTLQGSGDRLSVFGDSTKTSRKDLFGFQPGDIDSYGAYKTHNLTKVGGWKIAQDGEATKEHLLCKTKFDIMDATSPAELIRIAFFGGKTNPTDQLAHNFDLELPDHNCKLDVLNDYYDLIKNNGVINPGGGDNKYDSQTVSPPADTKKFTDSVNWIYGEVKKLVTIWDKNYSSIGSKGNETELDNDLATLESYLNASGGGTTDQEQTVEKAKEIIKQNWSGTPTSPIETKKAEITNRKGVIAGIPNQKTFAEKLADAKVAHADEPYKKIWEDSEVKGDEKVFDKVLELVVLLKKAYAKTDSANTKTKLETFKNATVGTNEEKAWTIIEKDDYKKAGKKLGTGALENLIPTKTPAQLLAEAKDTAKTRITPTEAYTAIIGPLTEVSQVNKAVEIWEAAQTAWSKKVSDNYDTELTNLTNLKKSTKAWTAVNQWKKNKDGSDCNDGYAEGALKHLQVFKDVLKKSLADIVKTDTKEARKKAIEKFKQNPDSGYQTHKTDFDDIYLPLLEVSYELAKSDATAEEKELQKLLGKVYWDYRKSEDIEKDIEKLKEYKGATDGNKKKVWEKISAQSVAFDKLLEKMQSKKQELLQSEKQDRQENLSPTDEGFEWTSPLGVTIIVGGIATVLGAIAYFIYTKNSSGEGEDE